MHKLTRRRLATSNNKVLETVGITMAAALQGHVFKCFKIGRGNGATSVRTGANGVSWPPGNMDEKLKSEDMQKRGCLCYILRAIRADRCRERRLLTTFIQIYFRMHNFVVKFSQFSSPQAAKGHWPPITKILWTPLCTCCWLPVSHADLLYRQNALTTQIHWPNK